MGMLDEKQYLTGTNGIMAAGQEFRLHDAQIAGQVRDPKGPGMLDEVRLLVSANGTEEPIWVYTTGKAIVGQVKRIDSGDRQQMAQPHGWHLRLGQLPPKPNQSPAYILEAPTAQDVDAAQEHQTSPAPTPGAPA